MYWYPYLHAASAGTWVPAKTAGSFNHPLPGPRRQRIVADGPTPSTTTTRVQLRAYHGDTGDNDALSLMGERQQQHDDADACATARMPPRQRRQRQCICHQRTTTGDCTHAMVMMTQPHAYYCDAMSSMAQPGHQRHDNDNAATPTCVQPHAYHRDAMSWMAQCHQ